MSTLSSPEVVASIIAVFLTVLAGVIGFFIRERIAQAKPFISVLQIQGENFLGGKTVDVPSAVVDSLRKVPILTELDAKESLQIVSQALLETEGFRDRGPELLEYLSALKRALSNSERANVEDALLKIFRSSPFNTWLTSLLGDGNVFLPDDDKNAQAHLPYSYEPDFNNGCFSIRIAGYSILLGRELNKFKLYRAHVEKLLPLISKFEYKKLYSIFDEVESLIRGCHNASKDAAPILQDIIYQNSLWSFRIFIANLGRTPFLIDPQATLVVNDTTGANYSESCELFLIQKNAEGSELTVRTEVPLIIRAQSDIILGFITKKTQAEMERGDAFREVYKTGKATCQLKLTAQQASLTTTATFQSPPVNFHGRS